MKKDIAIVENHAMADVDTLNKNQKKKHTKSDPQLPQEKKGVNTYHIANFPSKHNKQPTVLPHLYPSPV